MILDGLDAFAGSDYLTKTDIENIRKCHKDSIQALDGHVASFIQAFNFTQTELNSIFTEGDGQAVYERSWGLARQSSLSDNTFIRPVLLEARNLWSKHQAKSSKL